MKPLSRQFFLQIGLPFLLLGCATAAETSKDNPNNSGDTNTSVDTNTNSDTTTSSDTNTSVDTTSAGTATDNSTDSATGNSTSCQWPNKKYLAIEEVHQLTILNCPQMLLLNVVDEIFYNLGHIANSIEIPWDTLAQRLTEVDSQQSIVIYCRKGVRSENAYETLTAAGYPTLYVMENGLEAWIEAGYPVEVIE